MSITSISILIQRQFIEHKRIYGIGAFVLFALLIFMFLVIHQWQDSFSGAVQNGVFIIGLFVSGGVFSSTMFRELSSKQSAIWFLSMPAKDVEKVFLSVLLSVPFFILVYLLIFYLADLIYLYVIVENASPAMLDITRNNFYHVFFQYLIFNGLILLGGVIFNAYSLIKTILLCVILYACLNFLNNTLLDILIPEVPVLSSILFDSFLFSHQGENIKVAMLGPVDLLSSLFVRLILPFSLWIAVWLKLKEKEV
ncbi:MAG: hypothetical protein R8P61_11200 [Bacteroidia bacterium]|nr:hypothetical protein [Bacteroidia bacterium]